MTLCLCREYGIIILVLLEASTALPETRYLLRYIVAFRRCWHQYLQLLEKASRHWTSASQLHHAEGLKRRLRFQTSRGSKKGHPNNACLNFGSTKAFLRAIENLYVPEQKCIYVYIHMFISLCEYVYIDMYRCMCVCLDFFVFLYLLSAYVCTALCINLTP